MTPIVHYGQRSIDVILILGLSLWNPDKRSTKDKSGRKK
jgi:hypothetical protein